MRSSNCLRLGLDRLLSTVVLSSETVHSGDEHITNVVNAVSDSDCDDDDDILAACTCLLVLPTRR